ncbi:PD-(D/E)XK motif protein [bacterium]|nr:PD-(D/E)XK motif protein [bacterium]
MEDIETIWNNLEADNKQDKGFLRIRISPDSPCDMFLAVSKPDDIRALLLEVPSRLIPNRIEYPKSTGFTLDPFPITPGPAGNVRLILKISDNRYHDIFSVLVGDVIDHISIQTSRQAAIKEFIGRLSKWQEFLRKHPPEGLSDQEQQGLYGELWFLRKMLDNLDYLNALEAWVGPQQANQDFQIKDCAVEVKTSSTSSHQFISISNIRQLDGSGLGHLFVLHLSLDIRKAGVQSLPEIIGEIRTLLENDIVAYSKFNERLVEVGYLDIHQSKYDDRKYSIRNHNFFQVTDGFPRILEDNLQPGIGDVHYTIAVVSCMPFKVDDDKVMQYILGTTNE